jgi:hypothetical protein
MTPAQQAAVIKEIRTVNAPRPLTQQVVEQCRADPAFKAKVHAETMLKLERQRELADANVRAFVDTLHPWSARWRKFKALFS